MQKVKLSIQSEQARWRVWFWTVCELFVLYSMLRSLHSGPVSDALVCLLVGIGVAVEDVRQQSAVIHYCVRNKPWKSGYIGELNVFYEEIVSQMKKTMPALAERISEL